MAKRMKMAIQKSGTVLMACAIAIAVAMVVACGIQPDAAFAAKKQMDAPTTVSDDITRLHVNKLDADTHEPVQGATLQIINEATGEVVDSWISGSGTHENEKGLDVDVVYILRETQAPDGYGTVSDVRFVVNETEGTGITILSKGDDAELVESYKVNLYDKAGAMETTTVVTTGSDNAKSSTSKTVAPKTGDETPLSVIASLVIVGILLIMMLQVPKRRIGREDE